jgi:hypothetical protein
MKVNQVVSEHKKGVKAHIYNKKATTKAKGAVPLYGPDKQEAKLKPVKVAEDQTIGKVQQVNPDGTAVIQSADGNTQTVQQTQLQPGDNNKLSMQVPKITPGQQVDASKTIEEQPSNSTNTVDAIKKGLKLFASDGDPIEITSTRREVDQAYIADPVNKGNRVGYVRFNGKKYLALNTGHKWKIGPTAYGEITGMHHLPADQNKKYSTPQPGPYDTSKPSTAQFQKLEESADDRLLDKMLTIAGLR